MTDLQLFQTPDGGDLRLENNQLLLSDGLESLCFLALFGGNEDDSGSDADLPHQWWGNLDERNPTRRYRSETQHLLRALPLTSGNLLRIQDAITRDLQGALDGVGKLTFLAIKTPGRNRLLIEIAIEIDESLRSFSFEADGFERNGTLP